MSKYFKWLHKRYSITVLLYRLVFLVKYRSAMIDEAADKRLRDVCFELENHYQLKFLEVGTGVDHAHTKIFNL